MKVGRNLVALAQEIERQRESKKDYLAPVARLRVDDAAQLALPVKEDELDMLPLNPLAHRQLGEYVGIPATYYDRMREKAPELLAKNINHWFATSTEDKRMIRVLDGRVRALLSDGFRPLENADLFEAVYPALKELEVTVLSCEITERRMYIKAVDNRIERDIPTGKMMGDGTHTIFDTLVPVISISNSEVGSGALSVETGVFTRGCTNLAFFGERSMRKYHVGKRHEMTEDLAVLLSEKTRRLTDAALWAQVGDVVRGAFDKARFDAYVDKVAGLTETKLPGSVEKIVEVTAKRFGMVEGERSSVLRHLIEGGDLTRYGLFNAVTRTAEDLEDYDRATHFERLGGTLVELPANDWREIEKVAA